MAKLNWEINHPHYGSQGVLVANTRADAIAIAEANHLKQQRDYGPYHQAVPIPAFTAQKVTEMGPNNFRFSFS